MENKQREGVVVQPEERLSEKQVKIVDGMSRELLQDPGIFCYNQQAVEIFKDAGATVEEAGDCTRLRIGDKVVDRMLDTVPSRIVLGARNPDNRLILDAAEPRVRFGSGSETNVWLDVNYNGNTPEFTRQDGSIERLCTAAHLCENLEHLDFFIRCVNIQDKEVTAENKDVNKFLASLNNMTKHVMAGVTSLDALDDVIRMCEIIAGGEDAFKENPIISFITSVMKSPLQIVDDTADKLIAMSRRGVPVVISSCPMGGTTGPFDELGMAAQINAEELAGLCLNQLAAPGSPVLYGAVPVRCRLDNLNDMYGAPEFVHYTCNCAQMARHYGVPCYSTTGVGDADRPGIQATVEKLMTYFTVPRSGPQYVHYSFGLLERTNMFCPEQAVMDNAHIGLAKRMMVPPQVDEASAADRLQMIRSVMEAEKNYMYHLPLPTVDDVYMAYPLEDEEGGALKAAHDTYHEILAQERDQIPADVQKQLTDSIPGILPQTLK